MKRLLALATLITLLALPQLSLAKAGLPDFTDLAERAGKAVVNISTTKNVAGGNAQMREFFKNAPKNSPFRDFFEQFNQFFGPDMLGESGDIFGAHVQLAYSFHYGHDDQKARYHQDKAKGLISNAQQQQEFDELQRALGGGKGPGGHGHAYPATQGRAYVRRGRGRFRESR